MFQISDSKRIFQKKHNMQKVQENNKQKHEVYLDKKSKKPK